MELVLVLRKRLTRSVGGARVENREPALTLQLQFDLDSARLKTESLTPLRNLAAVLKEEALRGYIYRIEGHTCDRGGDISRLSSLILTIQH